MSEQDQKNEERDEIIPTDEDGNPIKSKKNPPTDDKNNNPQDEIISDDDAGKELEKLRSKLAQCVEEKQKYLDSWQRDKAEFVNARKRDAETNANLQKYAKEDLISELIPVLDSFDMAFGNKEAWEKVDKNWRMGVEFIHSQLLAVLKNSNLEILDPVNQKFDPTRDEAISYQKIDDKSKDQIIVSVLQKGYKLNEKIIKAPKVIVGQVE
jgi:molecular chaperone GrpE